MTTPDDMLREALGDKAGEMETHLNMGLTRCLSWAMALWAVAKELKQGSSVRKTYTDLAEAWADEGERYQKMLELMGVKADD